MTHLKLQVTQCAVACMNIEVSGGSQAVISVDVRQSYVHCKKVHEDFTGSITHLNSRDQASTSSVHRQQLSWKSSPCNHCLSTSSSAKASLQIHTLEFDQQQSVLRAATVRCLSSKYSFACPGPCQVASHQRSKLIVGSSTMYLPGPQYLAQCYKCYNSCCSAEYLQTVLSNYPKSACGCTNRDTQTATPARVWKLGYITCILCHASN